MAGARHALSLAVLAFAVEDMNARDWVITSARPWAFLYVPNVGSYSRGWRAADALLIPVQLAQFYQGQFLVAQTLCLFIISWWFAVGCGCYRYNLEFSRSLADLRFSPDAVERISL